MKKVFIFLILFGAFGSIYSQDEIARPDIPGELMVDLGLNYLDEISSDLNQQAWLSKSLGIYYTKRKIFKKKMVFNYGIGMGFENLDFGSNNTIYDEGGELKIDDFPSDFSDFPIQKNRLAITYLEVPLEMRFYPTGTEFGEGLFLSVGSIGGIRIDSHTKWKYNDEGDDKVQKNSGSFDLNRFRFGYQLRFDYYFLFADYNPFQYFRYSYLFLELFLVYYGMNHL